MPHKRAKRSVREQQRKERSAQIKFQYSTLRFPLFGLETQISLHPAALITQVSVPNASPSPWRGCWMQRGSALNIDRNVRACKPTRWTRTTARAHRSHHQPRKVARMRERLSRTRLVRYGRRGKITQLVRLRSSPGNRSSISIGALLTHSPIDSFNVDS
jgi:hypothetical protein